jgi:hypothetical protein
MDLQEAQFYRKKLDAEYEYLKYIQSIKLPLFLEETSGYVVNKYDPVSRYYFQIEFLNDEEKFVSKYAEYDEYVKKYNSSFSFDDYLRIHTNNIDMHKDKDKDINTKALYKKLSLICHPDKCKEQWSQKMFVLISNAYNKNDKILLQKIDSYWEKNKTLDGFDINEENNINTDTYNENTDNKNDDNENTDNKNDNSETIKIEKEIANMKQQFWYQWYYTNDSILKRIYIPAKKVEEYVNSIKQKLNMLAEDLIKENKKLKKQEEELEKELEKEKERMKKIN